jgi:hypothetical protein
VTTLSADVVTERRAAWASSLRALLYRRTSGVLRRYDSYSVLGAAELVFGRRERAGVDRWRRGEYGVYHVVADDGHVATSRLTSECADWSGLEVLDPVVRLGDRPDPLPLTALDGVGTSFATLATLLESLPTDWRGV